MKVLRPLILFSSLMFAASFGYGQNGKVLRLSLDQVLDRAKAHSYQARIARSQLDQAKGQRLESWSGFLPKVTVSEGYLKSNDPVAVFSMKLKRGVFSQQDFDIATLNRPDAFENFTTSLQIQQPLINLDAIYARSAARLGVKARQEALNRAMEAIAVQVKRGYYGLVLALENRQAIDEALASARAHRDDAKAAFEEGLATQADLLAAEVRLAELEEQRIMAEHQIANAGDQLKLIIGLEEEATIVPTDSLATPAAPELPGEFNDLPERRSDLRALRFQATAARRSVWLKRGNWFPRLNAFGSVEHNSSQAFRTNGSIWTVGVQLQWRLFDGFGNLGRSRQAAAKAKEIDIRYQQAAERAQFEVRKARRAIEAAQKRILVAQTAVGQARESLRIVEERYSEGLEKTSELLDKEADLTRARLRLLKARYDYNIALSELRFALGSR